MSHIEFIDQPIKKLNKDFFVQLIRIAMADDIIWQDELTLLNKIGSELGFTDMEIKTMIDNTVKGDYNPPYELAKRFEQVYDIVRMTLADNQIDNHEMRLANGFAAKAGFKQSEVPGLLVLLMRGIKEGKRKEELFNAYKRTRKQLNNKDLL